MGFKLAKTVTGYRATATRALVVAPCTANDPRSGTALRRIRARGLTVSLRAAGKELRGTRVLRQEDDEGVTTVRMAMRFLEKRQAKIVVTVRYAADDDDDERSNTGDCKGRLTVRATPRARAAP